MSDAPLPARGPRFDPTVNLGHILTIGSLAVAVLGGGFLADFRLSAVEKEVAKLGTIVVEQAKFQERLTDHGRRIDRLESWREGLSGQPQPKATPWTPP